MFRLTRSLCIALLLVPMMLAGFGAAGAAPATARPVLQDDSNTEVELIGVIDAMTTATITVNGLVIDISGAEIKLALAVGVEVKVQGSLEGGVIVAREVYSPQDDDSGNDDDPNRRDALEIRGLLSAINGTSYVIGGQAIDGSAAEIDPALAIRMIAEAWVTIDANGVWVAREIAPLSEDDDDFSTDTQVEYTGTLNAIGSDSILVGSLTFSTVGAELEDPLVVGILVKVEATLVDGALVARKVSPQLEGDDDNGNDNADDNSNDNDDNGNGNDNDDNGNDNAAVCPPVMPAGWTTYTVRAGDALSRIAAITDTDLDDLIEVNCITNANNIVVGQVLFVENAPRDGNDNDDSVDNGNDNSDDNGNDDHSNDNAQNENGNDNNDDQGNGNDNGDDNGNDDDGNGNDDDGGHGGNDDNGNDNDD